MMIPDGPNTHMKNILLTGAPGIGKTTVIMQLAEQLADKRVGGFYTEEIRDKGQRQGFRIATFSGSSAVLAHVSFRSRQRVGRYKVDVCAFEQLVIPELGRPCDVLRHPAIAATDTILRVPRFMGLMSRDKSGSLASG